MTVDRDSSRDRELVRHTQSFSSVDRALIPMWDSSDPERAPPPLPLNPGSPVLTTRPGTSSAIANAAKALEEKARESMPASSYTTNPMPQRSPERSLIKGAQHKRMQSLQTSGLRDLRSYLDNHKSPERSTERPKTRSGTPPRDYDHDYFGPETTSSFHSHDVLKEIPPLRPSARLTHKAILGENTPPSATMMALQNMTIPPHMLDPPISSATTTPSKSSPSPPAPASAAAAAVASPEPSDAITNQLLSITNIVSSLQKDMSQLSRRSKDNAMDLHGLKEATNQRDEDIRKSLKDLVSSMTQAQQAIGTPVEFSRSGSSLGAKDPFMTPTKPFAMPQRSGSPGFILEDRIGSPNPYSVEGAASVAMLEKIIREMVTKDGQDRLVSALEKIVERASGETAKKVTEMVEFVKQSSTNNATNASNPPPATGGPLTRTLSEGVPLHKVSEGGKPYSSPKAADFVSEEMLKFLRKIKDSVAEAGGVTMGNKALIQDLRGEVLGMGRDLARQIEEAVNMKSDQPSPESAPPNDEVGQIIQAGLEDLKEHMDRVLRDRRRQSVSSVTSRNTVDSNEVYDIVKHALAERGLDKYSPETASLDKEAILSAVRVAFEECQPNIEVETTGLKNEEVLECLREGLRDYESNNGVTKEQIEQIIQESLQQIQLPAPVNEAHEIRDEVLCAVRECLEELKPSLVPQSSSDALSRDIILDTMKQALAEHQPEGQTLDIPQEALYDAVKAGLESSRALTSTTEEPSIQDLLSLVQEMHSELKASPANGNSTEQVLEALREGLDNLKSQIEGYVDKAQDTTHKDEILDSLQTELAQLRIDVQGYVAEGLRGDNEFKQEDLVTYIKSEFEHLLEEMAKQNAPASDDREQIIQALNAGFDGMNSQVATRNMDPGSNEEFHTVMKEELELLKGTLLEDNTAVRGEVMEKLQSGFDGLQTLLQEHAVPSNGSNDELLSAMKEEFEHLRETLAGGLIRSGSAADKDDIIDAVREIRDGLRADQETSARENLAAFQQDLDNLKESFGNSLVKAEDPTEKAEILVAIKTALEELKESSASGGINSDLLEAFRGEFRISTAQIQQRTHDESVEVLDQIRLNVDDLRSHLEKKLDNPDRQMSATNDILDALNEGLEGLRADVDKAVNKPIDMTVTYEILDTLKTGLGELREDMEKLKAAAKIGEGEESEEAGEAEEAEEDEETPVTGNEVVLAEDPENSQMDETSREIIPESESLRRNDLEKMEVILAQLQTKVDALDANIQNPAPVEPIAAPGTAMKEDLAGLALKEDLTVLALKEDLTGIALKDDLSGMALKDDLAGMALKDDLVAIEELLKDVHAAVLVLQDRENPPPPASGLASKEDTDAIETLLDNMKAKLEELPLPDPATTATKEHLEEVELAVRTTSEAIEALAKKFEEDGASKADVTVVQVIADDIKTALDEMKASKSEEDPEPQATKADIDALSLLVDDLKAKLDELKIPDPDQLPTKTDFEQLNDCVNDLKERYEDDIAVTAKSFDDRRNEAKGLSENLGEVKSTLEEVKEHIKASLTEGGSLDGLKDSFKALDENINTNLNVTADVKELMETVSREFERAHGSIADLQVSQAEKSSETKDAIIAGFSEKVDERFDVLMAKYDDAQLLADEQAKVMKEKAESQEKILEEAKAMAEELRLTMDTLGTSITNMNEKFEESTQKWSADSSAVTTRVDEVLGKLDEQNSDDKTEHSHTRDEIKNIERIFIGLQDNVTEYHPKFMVALREIEALVKAHYDHAQKMKEDAEEHTRAMNEEAKNRAEELQKHFSSLPALLPPPPPAIELPEKYDDAQVQEKLDKLLCHVDEADKAAHQVERLDEIHAQVKATATELSEFVAKQTQLITDGNESKEREAEELALLVERRTTQKESLESDIEELKAEKHRVMQELQEEKERAMAELREEKERTIQEVKEEKDSLLAVVATLQAERENLANQKIRLTGQVSSLHTALEIRREELHIMDAKADALERRIVNGLMDHSRALMIAKDGRKSTVKSKKRMSVDVPADANKLMPPPSAVANGLSLALKPRPAIRRNGAAPNPASRRIHSLSQISGNTPTGAQAYPVTNINLSNAGIKRSQSVRTNNLRKGSWGGRPSAAIANKENEVLSEEDEAATERGIPSGANSIIEENNDEIESQTGTERRHSVDATSYTEDSRSEYGGTESMYSGSSYFTNSENGDRRASYDSAAHSAVHDTAESIDEESDEEHSELEPSSDAEDDDPTATIATTDFAAPSEVTASEVTASEVTGSELSTTTTGSEDDDAPLHTASEIDRAVQEVIAEELEQGGDKFAPPSDSGVGTDLPTADLTNESAVDADYFRRAAEEESTVG
ncbi:hypothetical protein DM02DRAFT_314253 [Periconia macrospinosa]|uniref:Chromosome segregation ATPase family protein n=1 Tax=Periconia macrospinosa TaxID=97972 RepID=A0A2V1D2X3_9PLEO|nr:hypothetical protein DM02DRAFT_314253 [Periconia macrospinosa]